MALDGDIVGNSHAEAENKLTGSTRDLSNVDEENLRKTDIDVDLREYLMDSKNERNCNSSILDYV